MSGPAETVYTLEAGGTPILTFAATSFREAQSLRQEAWLKEELAAARSNGTPVWDGAAPLTIRRADSAEAEQFAKGAKDADDESGDLPMVYLMKLDE